MAAMSPLAMHAAGEVVRAFSAFVTGGSLAVGVIIFTIIVVIQFVVITKGATRISEVAARFTLDAMPGKQMAIDADMNAGIINEAEARRRRLAISQEADFYGAMDGASKFVRGDAVAGIIITFVNILGGLYVGMVEHGWGLLDCLQLYTKLTIGDGLVSQIPAFIVSLGAGLIVTRTSGKSNLGDELLEQIFAKPAALVVAAAFLALLMVTDLPKFPLIVLCAGCGGIALSFPAARKRTPGPPPRRSRTRPPRRNPKRSRNCWNSTGWSWRSATVWCASSMPARGAICWIASA
jgi:flagellar biosynthesis protein FlhA